MLTAQGPFITMKTGPAEWAISTLVGLIFVGLLFATILGEQNWKSSTSCPKAIRHLAQQRRAGEALLGIEEATPQAKLTAFPRAGRGRAQRACRICCRLKLSRFTCWSS